MKLSHICENYSKECELCGEFRNQEEFHRPVPCQDCGQLMVNDTEGCSICAKEGGLCSSCWHEWLQRDRPSQQEEIPDNHFDDTEDEYQSGQYAKLIHKMASRSGFRELSHKYKP